MSVRQSAVLRFLLLALPLAPCAAQDPARMDQIVQSYVANHTFMGSVLVARGPTVLFSKGYGSANLEWDVPNAPNTKFRLGSVTKQFTAASILLLEERGKLAVTDPVKKYLPDAPAAWDKITIYNLLTHTSGIPNFTGFPDYEKLEPFPTTAEQLVARFRDKPLDFAPGSKWSYSNSGYVLLGYLIERISGGSYEAFVRDNIFTPLGMKESGYDSNAEVLPHRAAGYVLERGKLTNAGFINMTVPHGAGGLYSTTEDLLKWEQGLFGGKVLQPASLAKMTAPFKNNYAFGLAVDTVAGHKRIAHNGGIEGFNTVVSYYPDDKLTVIVLGNVNGPVPDELGVKLGTVALGQVVTLASERKEIRLDSMALNRFVGAYRVAGGPVMLVTRDASQLSAKLAGQNPSAVFPESPTMFFYKTVDAQLEFSGDDGHGKPAQLVLHQNGRDLPFTRLSDAEAKPLLDVVYAFAKRFKDQTPAAGGDAALRRLIEELRAGKPNYDLISPGPGQSIRQQLPQLQSDLITLGALQSTTFKGVGPGGADIYLVTFEKGALEYRIWLTPDGRIDNVNSRKPQ